MARPREPSDPAAGLPRSDRYELGDQLGTGGMGEVLSAHDIHLGRDVAVKRLRAAAPSADDLHRFLREARIQGRLDHPAIVPIHDLAIDDAGRPFFAMKRLAGKTLHAILNPKPADSTLGRWSRAQLLRAFVDVCLAIEFAHTRGVIHRDLKPGNIVLGDFGEIYVIDWGVARVLAEPSEPTGEPTPAPPLDPATAPTTPVPSIAVTVEHGASPTGGAILGTPGYIAPEQLRGTAAPGPAADIYALGAILFEILAGEALHPRGLAALASTTAGIDARPSRRTPMLDIPPELDAVCVRATALDPADRFGSARALADAVQGYLDGDRDLVLRRELARKHLADARAALAEADASARRRAMRAAAAALALDPASTEATELISRLLLEVPARVPPEVEAATARHSAEGARRHADLSRMGFVAYVSFVPVFLWIGVRDWAYLGLAYGLVALNLVWGSFTRRMAAPPPYRAWVSAAIHAMIVALIGRLFGPWLVAPSLAAVTLAILATHPHLGRTWVLWLMFGAAALAPWALELAGVATRTYRATADGFTIWSAALENEPVRGQVGVLLWIVGVIAIAGALSRRVARVYRDHLVQTEIQAWQLRQLVPEITTGAARASG